MVKIITIHGTNAGRPENDGDQWWQKGSPFEQRLQELIEEPVEFEPFHWSGANSERQRRKAGAKLAKLIATESEPPIVVGHSHGGSVAAHALFHLHLKLRRHFADRIRALVTVGTPMLRFKGTLNPLARLRPLAQLVLLIGLALALSWVINLYTQGNYAPYPYLAGGAAAIVAVLYLFIRRSLRRASAFRRNLFAGALSGKYAPLNHSIDEAVLALKSVGRVRLTFLKSGNLRGGVRALLFTAFAITWFLSHLTLSLDGGSPYARATAPRADVLYGYQPGLADDRNDMIVKLEPGRRLAAPTFRGDDRASDFYMDYSTAHLTTQFAKHFGAPGLEYGSAIARSDYLVIDYATAYAKRDLQELTDYIAAAGRTARASYFCWRPKDRCQFRSAALYLTPEGRDLLLAAAEKLRNANSAYAGPIFVRAGLLSAQMRKLPFVSNLYEEVEASAGASARFYFVEMLPNRTPFDEVLNLVGPRELASWSLLSPHSLPPAGGKVYAARSYPMIERGDGIVLPRNMGTSYHLQCGAAKALGFNPMIVGEPLFLQTVTRSYDERAELAYCDQFSFASNGPFEVYRGAFTALGVKALEFVFESSVVAAASSANLVLAFIVAVAAALLAASAFLAFWIGPLIIIERIAAVLAALGLRGVVGSQLQNAVYGNDGYGEQIAAVAPGIDFDQRDIGTLPPDVEEKIAEHSLRYSEAALRKVREIISLSAKSETSPMLADLGTSLTWQELIHTAYFDVPEFKAHFAKELARIAGLTLRADPMSDRWAGSSLSSASALAE